MRKEDLVIAGFWEMFHKKIWLDEYEMKKSLTAFKPSEIHCIDYIGTHVDANVTSLAQAFYMTRSATSKITKKLIEKKLIESYQKPENKKEIYYQLTPNGREIYNLHEQLHKEFQERDQRVFDQITEELMDQMIAFAQLYNQHLEEEIKKLGIDVKKNGFDTL